MAVPRAYNLQDLFNNLAGSINANSDTSAQFQIVDNFLNDGETLIISDTLTAPTVTTATNYPVNVLGDYPVNYWRLAEPASTGHAFDSNQNLFTVWPRISSNTLPAAITQGVSSFYTAGVAAQFTNASTGQVVFNNATSLQIVGDLTIEFWFNASSLGTSGTTYALLTKEGAGVSTGEYEVYFINTAGVGAIGFAQSGLTTFSGGTLNASTWYHVVVTRTAATKVVVIYVNGVQVATQTYVTPPTATTNNVVIGAKGSFATLLMSVTEVALYAIPLSSSRVSTHYGWGTAATVTATPYGGSSALYGTFSYPLLGAPTSSSYGNTTWGTAVWQ